MMCVHEFLLNSSSQEVWQSSGIFNWAKTLGNRALDTRHPLYTLKECFRDFLYVNFCFSGQSSRHNHDRSMAVMQRNIQPTFSTSQSKPVSFCHSWNDSLAINGDHLLEQNLRATLTSLSGFMMPLSILMRLVSHPPKQTIIITPGFRMWSHIVRF